MLLTRCMPLLFTARAADERFRRAGTASAGALHAPLAQARMVAGKTAVQDSPALTSR